MDYPGVGFLTGKLLLSMPYITEPHLSQTVIYICGHDDKGAMGLVINRALKTFTFPELLQQLAVDTLEPTKDIPLCNGGETEAGRGFVLHTNDYITDSTVIMPGGFALTATLEVLRAIVGDRGPDKALLALGYMGWTAGQLEKEYQSNNWLSTNATPYLVFNPSNEEKWHLCLESIGVDPKVLSLDAGRA